MGIIVLLGGRQVFLGLPAEGVPLLLAGLAAGWIWARRRRHLNPVAVAVGIGTIVVTWSSGLIALAATFTEDGQIRFCLFDDAFVSLRYAWNLAHGEGLVWNPGERVEGFTNPLWTLSIALPCLFLDRSGAALAVHLLGLASLLGAVAATWRLAHRLGGAPLLAFGGALACYPLAYWSVLGMETGLLAALLTAAAAAAVEERPAPDLRAPLWLGLAACTRPDGIIPGAVLLAWRATSSFADRRRDLLPLGPRLQRLSIEAAAFLALPTALGVFRWSYYGSLVPNTYVLKMEGLPLAHRLSVGGGSALTFLAWVSPLVLLALIGGFWRDRRRQALAAAWASVVMAHVYVGGDAWPRWRFLCPAVPFLAVLAADGVRRLARVRPGLAPLALLLGLAIPNGPFLQELFLARHPFGVSAVQVQALVAGRLSRLCTPDASVGVFYAGTVPYYTGLRGIDLLGKTDPHVARQKPRLELGVGHNKTDLAYSIGRLRPDYVEDLAWPGDDPGAVRDEYVLVEGLWLRRDSPHVRWELTRRP